MLNYEFKDEIPSDGKRQYNIIDKATNGIIHQNCTLERSNGNDQEGTKINALVMQDIVDAINNTEEVINKRVYKAPEGYEITDNGIILLRDIDVGTIECTGWYYCVDCTGLPISESCYMEVKVHPTSTYHATQHFISANTGNEFKRNKVGGIWGRWLLTAGEVLLWSGSVQEVNSEINLLHNKDMFGTLAVTISGVKISASNSADLIPFVTLFNYWNDKTALIKTAIFTVVNSKKLTLYSSSGQINFNYASNSDFVKLPVTAIYGRP